MSRPRTRADTVAVTPLASLTTSLLSALRWCPGRAAWRTKPTSVPPHQAREREQEGRHGAHNSPLRSTAAGVPAAAGRAAPAVARIKVGGVRGGAGWARRRDQRADTGAR